MPLLDDLWTYLAAAGAAIWLAILILPWQPWRTRERFEAGEAAPEDADLSQVTVLIPARDEAPFIGATLAALGSQGGGIAIVLIDDRSEDGTAEAARVRDARAFALGVQWHPEFLTHIPEQRALFAAFGEAVATRG